MFGVAQNTDEELSQSASVAKVVHKIPTNFAARWVHRVEVMMNPGMEMPKATFSMVPPALASEGLATYCPQKLEPVSAAAHFELTRDIQVDNESESNVASY